MRQFLSHCVQAWLGKIIIFTTETERQLTITRVGTTKYLVSPHHPLSPPHIYNWTVCTLVLLLRFDGSSSSDGIRRLLVSMLSRVHCDHSCCSHLARPEPSKCSERSEGQSFSSPPPSRRMNFRFSKSGHMPTLWRFSSWTGFVLPHRYY